MYYSNEMLKILIVMKMSNEKKKHKLLRKIGSYIIL